MELDAKSIKKLSTCDEVLHILFKEVAHGPYVFIITHGHRTIEEQQQLFAQGRVLPGKIVTNCDGVIIKSKHNYFPSKACDIALKIDGKISWSEGYYKEFGEYVKNIALNLGLKIFWGGDWKQKDYPHFEI